MTTSSLTPSTTPSPSSAAPAAAARSSSSSSGSVSSSSSYDTSDEEAYEAELAAQEWARLVSQTKLLIGLAVPFFAAYFGRRVAFKAFHKYAAVGLGRDFWLSWWKR